MIINSNTIVAELGFVQTPDLRYSASIHEATSLLLDKGLKTLPVIDENGIIVGIISATDIIKYENVTTETRVSDVMNKAPITILYNQKAINAIGILTDKQYVSGNYQIISNLPVVDESNRLLGLLSYQDALRAIKEIIEDEIVSSLQNDLDVEPLKREENLEYALFVIDNSGVKQVLVVDEQKNGNIYPIGFIKDTEIFRLMNTDLAEESIYLRVESLMTKLDIFKILTPRHKLARVVELFTSPDLDLKIFPIVSKGNLIGAVTYTGVLKFALTKIANKDG
jgi:predicted transcriptional regulator